MVALINFRRRKLLRVLGHIGFFYKKKSWQFKKCKNCPDHYLTAVMTNTKNQDLINLCLVSQHTYKICTSDELFRNIVKAQYPGLVEKKMVNITWRDWYKKIINSGALYVEDNKIATNVCSSLLLNSDELTLIYLTLDGNLYLFGSYPDIVENYAFGFLTENIRETLEDNPSDHSLLLATNVEDFNLVEDGFSLMLNKQGDLYYSTIGPETYHVATNCREILSREPERYFVVRNWDNNVYTLDAQSLDEFEMPTTRKFEKLDFGIVRVVELHHENSTFFFAVNQDGSLCCYTKSWNKGLIPGLDPKEKYAYNYIPYTNKIKLFESGVKDVTIWEDSLLILDLSGHIWENTIPYKSEIPFITNSNSTDQCE